MQFNTQTNFDFEFLGDFNWPIKTTQYQPRQEQFGTNGYADYRLPIGSLSVKPKIDRTWLKVTLF